jgi:hypothetical protein
MAALAEAMQAGAQFQRAAAPASVEALGAKPAETKKRPLDAAVWSNRAGDQFRLSAQMFFAQA